VDAIIAKGQPYTDPDFLPNHTSIGKHAKAAQITWKRISEIFKTPEVFASGIDPNDVKQGSLGDCYYLAALSSMAEDPKDILALFYTKKINTAGCYLVYLYINGVKRPVILDDYLPCFGDLKNFDICFGRSRV
jgi:calpain-15